MMAEDKSTEDNLYSIVDDHRRVIQEKIKCAFMNASWLHTRWLIQFWAPVSIGGRQLLTSFRQPVALSNHGDPLLQKYRLLSQRYAYSIDDHVNQEEDNPMIILIGGPVAAAFHNNFLEVVLEANHLENPLVHSALECKLASSLFIPVFYCHPSSEMKNASCVGVIECSTISTGSDLVRVLNELKNALERVGLNMFHVQKCRPYKTIRSLKHARDEIEEALAIVCQSHNLILAQVWIPYENESHDHVSSSLRDTQMEQTTAVKLIGCHTVFDDGDFLSSITPYHDTCDMFPLKMGEGLVGKTLQTYETHFCRNIGKLSDNRLLMLSLSPATNNVSCLTICLKSNHTGNLDYGFELLWHQSRNYHILLPSLLITLKRFLPSFTFACGAKLGDEFSFLAVDNSEGNMIRCSCNSNGNKLSPLQSNTSSTPLLREKDSGREETLIPKRKLSDQFIGLAEFSEDYSYTSSSCSSNCAKSPDIVSVMFKAEYGDDLIAFHLPVSSATIVAVEKQISDRCEVNRPYKLEYLDYKNAWILMDEDADVRFCIKYRNENSSHIRLRVTNNCLIQMRRSE
ncbi:NIN-like protein [Artemisia annua]|uniref:NIN-like protein n=1 Tax=Artemisia annua TaxID=35608 RepID=A0A2U1NXX9_ARTAN|nr:NIN-like protein [Artemisia annua]